MNDRFDPSVEHPKFSALYISERHCVQKRHFAQLAVCSILRSGDDCSILSATRAYIVNLKKNQGYKKFCSEIDLLVPLFFYAHRSQIIITTNKHSLLLFTKKYYFKIVKSMYDFVFTSNFCHLFLLKTTVVYMIIYNKSQ